MSLSERPFRRPIEEIFAEFDAAGGAEFKNRARYVTPPQRLSFYSGSYALPLRYNTVSFLVNERSPAVRKHYMEAEKEGTRISISAITEAEALFGLAKRPEATRLRENFERFFAAVELLPWDSKVAQAYGMLRAELVNTGKNLALMDVLIASHAIAIGARLVTHDRALLQVGSSLHVVDWATDP